MWSSAVTKVSKKRHVRRATSRSAGRRLGERQATAASGGAALIHTATSRGQHPQQQRTALRRPGVVPSSTPMSAAANGGDGHASAHGPIGARGRAAGSSFACAAVTHSSRFRRLTNRRNSVRADRIDHQPGLMREEGEQEGDLQQAPSADLSRSARRWLRSVTAGAAGHDAPRAPEAAAAAQIVRRRKAVQMSACCEWQQPADEQGEKRWPAPTATAQIVEHLPAADQRKLRRPRVSPASRAPRPKIHGSNCQSPRAQRCWRAAATS